MLVSPPRDLEADGGPNDLDELSPDMDNDSLLPPLMMAFPISKQSQDSKDREIKLSKTKNEMDRLTRCFCESRESWYPLLVDGGGKRFLKVRGKR